MNSKTKYAFLVMILYGSIIQSFDIPKESEQTTNSTLDDATDTTDSGINGSKNGFDYIKNSSKKNYKKTKPVRKKINDFFTKGKI